MWGPSLRLHGGFARAIAVDAARLYRIHPKLSDEQAAMLEPATVAVHALRKTPMRLGDTAVVLGAGPIGLLVSAVRSGGWCGLRGGGGTERRACASGSRTRRQRGDRSRQRGRGGGRC